MTQFNNRLFDEFSRLVGDASGTTEHLRREFESMMKSQFQSFSRSMGHVTRDEFDTLFELTKKTGERLEALEQRISDLEKSLPQKAPKSRNKTSPKAKTKAKPE